MSAERRKWAGRNEDRPFRNRRPRKGMWQRSSCAWVAGRHGTFDQLAKNAPQMRKQEIGMALRPLVTWQCEGREAHAEWSICVQSTEALELASGADLHGECPASAGPGRCAGERRGCTRYPRTGGVSAGHEASVHENDIRRRQRVSRHWVPRAGAPLPGIVLIASEGAGAASTTKHAWPTSAAAGRGAQRHR
ncbi:hypothetical protein DENSPDRAFT_343579 [Dentipellis sp. KUC8613]|nr:hypothetical protein DENSPDRAFT_343579 [Dentipellis sp. KUC8613]